MKLNGTFSLILTTALVFVFTCNMTFAADPVPLQRPALLAKADKKSDLTLAPERQVIWQVWKNQFQTLKKRGVTKDQIVAFDHAPDEAKNKFGLLRIQIIDQKIYLQSCKEHSHLDRADYWLKGLEKVVAKYKIKNVDLVLSYGDSPPIEFNGQTVSVPIMHADKPLRGDDANIILVPDIYMISTWPKIYKKIKAAQGSYPWDKKSEKVFWRGAATGGNYDLTTYDKLPRLSLVMMSRSYPNKVDAKFTGDVQLSANASGQALQHVFTTLSLEGPRVKEVEHLAFKYLISMDGNVSAWLRPEWIMASNSVLMFQHRHEQWYYPAMKPWVHFVPLEDDISDVFEKLEWLRTHDAEARTISENANKFVETVLQPEHITEDLAFLLNEYADLQNYELTEPTLPPAEVKK